MRFDKCKFDFYINNPWMLAFRNKPARLLFWQLPLVFPAHETNLSDLLDVAISKIWGLCKVSVSRPSIV